MFLRSLAILLAVLGLNLSAGAASAQPRGGFRGGGFFRGAGRGGPFGGYRAGPGFGGPAFGGGFRPRAYPAPAGGFGPYRGGFPAGGAGRYPPPPTAGYGEPRLDAPGRAAFGGDWRTEQDEVRSAVREGRHIPLGQAIEAVRRLAPGRELDAGLEAGPNGRSIYRLRWAGQDGRRRDYMVDAGTGAVLGVLGGP